MSKSTTDVPPQSAKITYSEQEIAQMSSVLVTKYGSEAINIAAFFLDEHLNLEDQVRAESWMRVMNYLDQKYGQDLKETLPS